MVIGVLVGLRDDVLESLLGDVKGHVQAAEGGEADYARERSVELADVGGDA